MPRQYQASKGSPKRVSTAAGAAYVEQKLEKASYIE
jgi:hypothetical protein